jgi:hypothetical protein
MASHISAQEFSDRAHVPYSTVARWCQTGRIPAEKTPEGWRIPVEVLEAHLDESGRMAKHRELMIAGSNALALARDYAAARIARELADEAALLRFDDVSEVGYRAFAEWAEPLLRVARQFDALRHFDTASAELSTYDETGELVPE